MSWEWLKDVPTWQKVVSASAALFGSSYAIAKVNPRLWIEYNEKKSCCVESHEDYKDGAGRVRRKHIRLIVHNDGLKAAKGCRISLTSVVEVSPSGLNPLNYSTPLRLLWAKEGSGKNDAVRTISKGEELVDLIRTDHYESGDRILICDVEYTRILELSKRYRFTVLGRAEDVPEFEIIFDVLLGHSWQNFQVSEPRDLVIRSHKKRKPSAR